MMMYQKILFLGLTSLSFLAISACTSDNTTANADQNAIAKQKAEQVQTPYRKPGASIEFTHNYDGKTNPGEVETFQVFVNGGSLTGSVGLEMENPDGLTMYSDASARHLDIAEDAPDGLDHTMNVSVSAQTPGRYYLKFTATSDQDGASPMTRGFAIAIQVGDQPYVPKLGKGMTAEETPTGEKIITMEAEETIEN